MDVTRLAHISDIFCLQLPSPIVPGNRISDIQNNQENDQWSLPTPHACGSNPGHGKICIEPLCTVR